MADEAEATLPTQRGLRRKLSCSAWLMMYGLPPLTSCNSFHSVSPVFTSCAGTPRKSATTMAWEVDMPVPISIPMWRRLMRPSAVNSMLAIGASEPVPKSFWQMAKPTPYQLSGSAASRCFLIASRFFQVSWTAALSRISCRRKAPAGIAPWVFFMPERSAFLRRSSMASTPRRPAISSTIISVAAMLCRVP
ncbi:hypothetical protein D3C73_831160 [compost metagenome]